MDADKSLIGYAYYHAQDREGVIHHDDPLYVGFGARDASDEESVIIGQQLHMLFAQDGFKVEWNGSSTTRLKISLPKDDE
jgi:hypothetical protein